MNQSDFNVETIQNFLNAYPRDDVKRAVSDWAKAHVSGRKAFNDQLRNQMGWTKHDGTYWNIPKGYDWQLHGKEIWIKPSQAFVEQNGECKDKEAILARAAVAEEQKKQDLTPVPSDFKCPVCGELTVKEPICRGCKEGLAGFTFRYICMDDVDHIFYTKDVEDPIEVE